METVKSNREKYIDIREKYICKHKRKMEEIEKILDTIDKYSEIKKDDSFENIVFKKYLQLENVKSVAKYLNDEGYRIKTYSYKGERKYIGTDVTRIISNKYAKVDDQLKDVVRLIQKRNYESTLKKWS